MIHVDEKKMHAPGVVGTSYQVMGLEMALRNYAHLLYGVTKRYSFDAFADLIEQHYDTKGNPQNAETVRVLRKLQEQNPPMTYLIVPACTDQAGQCRIAQREGDIADALKDYRADPDAWSDVGLMNSRGNLVCLNAPSVVYQEFKSMEPLMAGTQVTL